jgi:ribosomal protein S21
MSLKNNSYKKRKMSKKKREFLSISPGNPTGVDVVDGDINYALRVWKRNVKDSGIMYELYKRRDYTKPTTARRKVKLDAIYKQRIGSKTK